MDSLEGLAASIERTVHGPVWHGSALGAPADDEDWPPVSRTTPTAWKTAVRQLGDAHCSLADAVRRLDPALLDRNVPRREYTVRAMLHGVVEHGAYHGGQIAMLVRQLRR